MINKLILGTVQLGLDYGINNRFGKPSQQESFDILNTAFDNGIDMLDTAEAYGNSQQVIGQFLKESPKKRFKIITKLNANANISADQLFSRIEQSCASLHIDSLHGYMFHSYQSFQEKVSLYPKLLLARESGLISKAGISLYTNDELKDILENYPDFDFIQIPFNVFDNSIKRKELLERAKSQNIEVHTRSVFLQGLFFKQFSDLPQALRVLKPYFKQLNTIAIDYKLSMASLALHYVLQKPYIDKVLIGVETSQQLISNINICNKVVQVPHNKIDAIDVLENELLNPSNWN